MPHSTLNFPPYPEWVESFREEQNIATERICRNYRKGTPLVLVDAPTGIGKSLIPDMVRRAMGFEKSIYVTPGIELQEQVQAAFPYSRTIKGRDNYAPERYPSFEDSTGMRVSCADCTYMKDAACPLCYSKGSCTYEIAKGEACGHDYVNMNSSYFLSEANYVHRFSGWDFVAIDEADTLDQQLMKFVEIRVPRMVQKQLAVRAPRHVTKPESWAIWYEDTMRKLGTWVDSTDTRQLSEPRQIKFYNRCKSLWTQLKDAGGLDGDMWTYVGDDNEQIVFRPTEPSPWGMPKLFNHAKHMLLMSATLLSGDVVADALGYDGKYDVVYLPSPFPKENRQIRLAPIVDMSYKARAEGMEKLAAGVKALMEKYPNENILVHTHTFATAKAIKNALGDSRVLTYTGKQDRHIVLEFFKSRRGAVLLAPSMERGIDLPDELCRVNVIAQLPYPYIGDRQISKRVYGTGAKGQRWYLAETMRSLIQMCGRGVRHVDDWCHTWVLDSRAPKFIQQCKREGIAPKWWVEGIVSGPWIGELGVR